jgi:hypothetical protein
MIPISKFFKNIQWDRYVLILYLMIFGIVPGMLLGEGINLDNIVCAIIGIVVHIGIGYLFMCNIKGNEHAFV